MRSSKPNLYFPTIYKCVYLVFVGINLFVLYQEGGFRESTPYLIGLFALFVNTFTWMLFLRSNEAGVIGESILSIGRLLVILLGVSVFFGDVIAYYSPVGRVVWLPLAVIANRVTSYRLTVWWTGCSALLILESMYFRVVSRQEPRPERTGHNGKISA
jgi:hypothetical protein